jgi:transglutaminase-like putative cysteine protease
MFFTLDRHEIDEGDHGIIQTVGYMQQLIEDGRHLPAVRALAHDVAGGSPSWYDAAAQLREWVAQHWRFVDDPETATLAEVLYGPEPQLTIIERLGYMPADCDDAAILLGSLARSIGMRARIVCVGFLTPTAPYTHTWIEVRPPLGTGAWLEGDVTRPMQQMPISQIGRAAAWSL